MVTLHEVITFLVSMQISISSLQTHNVNRCGRSRHLARKLRDRKSGSAGMPRPSSYAVFCLKKKKVFLFLQKVLQKMASRKRQKENSIDSLRSRCTSFCTYRSEE